MNKIGIFLVAAIAIGMFALPATMAYFTGQHEFVAGGNVQCTKCHTDVDTEYYADSLAPHTRIGMACSDCHVSQAMNTSSMNPTGKAGHASIAVECVDCHMNNVGPQVGAGSNHDITSATAAHNGFYISALNDDDMYGANEACVGCHTHVAVQITWTKSVGNMSYTQGIAGANGTFGQW